MKDWVRASPLSYDASAVVSRNGRFRDSQEPYLYDCLDLEATHHVHCGQTEDHRNAAKAFVEKREPVFQGR